MKQVIIRCRLNGPLVVEGAVVVVDHLGQPFVLPENKPRIALCRCGQSGQRPFCDGSHRGHHFSAQETAGEPPATT